MRTAQVITLIALLTAVSTQAALPQPNAIDPAASDFFEKKIRPVLSQQCFKCHSTNATKLKGNLYLDSREGAVKGGDTGPAVVPGHPEKSLMVDAVKWTDKDMQMPPKNRLPDSAVADLVKWVQMGAPWPGEIAEASPKPAEPSPQTTRYEKLRREHWAWQPLAPVAVPVVENGEWARCDTDRYVLAKLEEEGLKPVADADRLTLIRRVSFDLAGLPPTPDEVQAFLTDRSDDAFAKVVDRLLASKAFGERWARHWLDVARYAESTGSTRNVPYPQAWRYRDYVIDAFNKDKPFNQFVQEQIAGDLMPTDNPAQHDERTVATGFLALGVKDLNEGNPFKYSMDVVDEQIDTTSRSILALTVSCARCHDHKFDPIPTSDYYAMAGIFRSTEIMAGVHSRRGARNYSSPASLVKLVSAPSVGQGAPKPDPAALKELTDELQQARTRLERVTSGNGKAGVLDPKQRRRATMVLQQQVDELSSDLESIQSGSFASLAIGVQEASSPSDARVCIHGEIDSLGPAIPRGFVSLPLGTPPQVDRSHSGRLELAKALTSRDNPLTSRVIVNRIWKHLFGQGLVRTVDNFGSTGEPPSHPQLLDYLATQFMDQGWSVKKMIRSLVLSHAYQLSSGPSAANSEADPGDRYLWRMNPRALEAEPVRDAMLSASGRLNLTPPLGSPVMFMPTLEIREGKFRRPKVANMNEDVTHRSVYLPILRELVPPVLAAFDFAEPSMVNGARDTTTVPTQALFLMNDPFVMDQAHAMAQRLLDEPKTDDYKRIELAYRLALSRPPTLTERHNVLQFLSEYARANSILSKGSQNPRTESWASFCQALFASAEFRYLN